MIHLGDHRQQGHEPLDVVAPQLEANEVVQLLDELSWLRGVVCEAVRYRRDHAADWEAADSLDVLFGDLS